MRVPSLAVLALLSACQPYDFDPVVPRAFESHTTTVDIVGQPKPPKIMLALDRSGSMKSATAEDAVWGCCTSVQGSGCSGYDPVADCKWNTLKRVLGEFLQSTQAMRHGLALFPDSAAGADTCASGRVEVPVSAEAGGATVAIQAALEASSPSGGTPTAGTLQGVLADSAFMTDEPATGRWVVLVTDGLPNCNARLDPGTCACTAASCTANPKSCVDDVRLVEAVTALRSRGVQTFVIGFGSAFDNPIARRVLDQAAEAGGQAQATGDTRFFRAGSSEQLEAILAAIGGTIQGCTFSLGRAATDADLVEVRIEDLAEQTDIVLSRTDWELDSPSSVSVLDPWCARLKASAPNRFRLHLLSVDVLSVDSH